MKQPGNRIALNQPMIVEHLISSMNTKSIPSRRTCLDILTFLCYWEDGSLIDRIISSLNNLHGDNKDTGPPGPYGYWFGMFERHLAGRGKMGSLVGASDEIRNKSGSDSSLLEYTVR